MSRTHKKIFCAIIGAIGVAAFAVAALVGTAGAQTQVPTPQSPANAVQTAIASSNPEECPAHIVLIGSVVQADGDVLVKCLFNMVSPSSYGFAQGEQVTFHWTNPAIAKVVLYRPLDASWTHQKRFAGFDGSTILWDNAHECQPDGVNADTPDEITTGDLREKGFLVFINGQAVTGRTGCGLYTPPPTTTTTATPVNTSPSTTTAPPATVPNPTTVPTPTTTIPVATSSTSRVTPTTSFPVKVVVAAGQHKVQPQTTQGSPLGPIVVLSIAAVLLAIAVPLARRHRLKADRQAA